MAATVPLLLIIRRSDGSLERRALRGPTRIPAEAGADYALVAERSGASPEGLRTSRRGDDLVVELDEETLVVEDFYSTPDAGFLPQASLQNGALDGAAMDAGAPDLGDRDDAVWEADDDDDGGASPWLWGGAALGAGALIALAQSDGRDDDRPPPEPPEEPEEPEEPGIVNTVEGSVVGGPVIDDNGLSVAVYQADGTTLLGTTKVNADGSFSLDVGGYSGVVIARIVDADAGADHLDEATNSELDLTAELSAVEVITEPNSTVTMNINILTTLAAELALREAAGAPLTPEDADTSNSAIAELFGLPSLHGSEVAPTNGGSFDASDGLSPAEQYGAILASFSGADLLNGGDSQQALDEVLAGLTLDESGRASLSQEAQATIVRGAERFVESEGGQASGLDSGDVSLVVDTFAPVFQSGAQGPAFPENGPAGQTIYQAAASDAGRVRFSLAEGGDSALLAIDLATGAVTLAEPADHEAKSSYAFTVVATDAAGNSSEQAVTVDVVDVDESAPTITSGATAAAIDENSGAGQVVYTATATDEGDISGGVAFSLAGADAAAFTIDAATGAVTLTADPDHETKSSYAFTVVATDAAGNSAEQAVALAINDVDDSAPTITSGDTAAAIGENSGAGQVVYTATAIDEGDISGGVAFSLAGADAAAFTIDAATGAVTLTADPDYEAKSSYAFTVVATDAAGNSAEQAVALAISNVDDTPPVITSSATAPAIDENSGAGQVVYTATADDSADVSGGVAFSLQSDEISSFIVDTFTIDPETGEVTLNVNPDYEARPSYTFTVVATDAAGNADSLEVTLPINDIADEVSPSVESVSITSETGAQNGILNAGDVLTATVAMSEDTEVDTAGGAPRLALNIGGATVYASYVSGSGTSELVFSYTIQEGENDANGVAVPENALEANGAILRDASSNAADLAHAAAADDASYTIDTAAPSAQLLTSNETVSLPLDVPAIQFGNNSQAAALGPSGAFAVVWQTTTSGETNIYVQRFDASGSRVGGIIAVEPEELEFQQNNTANIVAIGDDGAFAVTWQGRNNVERSTFLQRFDADGEKVGGQAMLEPNAWPLSNHPLSHMAALGDAGAFAVAWVGNSGIGASIYVQRFAEDGSAAGSPTILEADGAIFQQNHAPRIAAVGGDGAFVVTWHGYDGAEESVFAQRFDADGAAVGSPILVEPDGVTNGADTAPQIAALGDAGAFAIVWRGYDGQDPSVFVQSFDSLGAKAGPTILVEPDGRPDDVESDPRIAPFGADGEFVVTWLTGDTVYAQLFAADGTKAAPSLALEANRPYSMPEQARVASLGDSAGFVATWAALGSGGDFSIFVKTFDADGAPLTDGAVELNAPSLGPSSNIQPHATPIGDEGAFVVTWSGIDAANNYIVHVQRFDADGTTTGTSLIRNSESIDASSSEAGEIYLVSDSVTVESLEDILGAPDALWNSVSAGSGGAAFAIAALGLADGSYRAYSADAAGNLSAPSQQTLSIDSTSPAFESEATAPAIEENSGAGQVVYTAQATDPNGARYSLAEFDDFAAFSIDPQTGAVTLADDPDFETKAAYSFTVVATDSAGNAAQQVVTLAINDIEDETGPAVESIAISSALGAEGNLLNAGDSITVSVAMSEDTIVDTQGGSPRIALAIGGATVYASYVGVTGENTLLFGYTVQAGQTDADGISIPQDALEANGAAIYDPAGNAAVLAHAAVDDDPAYLVDTAPPELQASAPSNGAAGISSDTNITLTFDETILAGEGNITLTNGTDTRVIPIGDAQISIAGSELAINPSTDLTEGATYHVLIDSGALLDAAGNEHPGLGGGALSFDVGSAVDTSIVVFDLVDGQSSSHSGREFNSEESYTIYIRLPSESHVLNDAGPNWGIWTGAEGVLGSDDKVVFVGSGTHIVGQWGYQATQTYTNGGGAFFLLSGSDTAFWAAFVSYTFVSRAEGGQQDFATLWNAVGTSLPHLWQGSAFPHLGIAQHYLTDMPAGVMTSQGLA